ncbi:hypothetical protein C0992_005406, partial [Termitomyces sp. T32_za158]
MGESSAAPQNDTSISTSVLSRPTPPSLVGEDEDEPPSSGSLSRTSEVKPKPRDVLSLFTNEVGQEDAVHSVAAPVAEEKQTVAGDPEGGAAPRTDQLNGRTGSRLSTLFQPAQPIAGPKPTYKSSAVAAITYTPLNVCLLFIPVSWALHYTHQSPTIIFVFSALGIIPLAALLGLGTEQIALRTSQSVGGLLNATLGNIVEMIIAGIALKR